MTLSNGKGITHFGIGEIEFLGDVLADYTFENVLLVRGEASFSDIARKQIELLPTSVKVTHFSGFRKNPDVVDVARALNFYRGPENNPDVIIAIGGGSAIDTAKLIRAGLDIGYQTFIDTILAGEKIELAQIPLIAVPTTAGTGSEATSFAVVYIDGIKYSLAGAGMLPEIALIDPRLSFSMPATLTAECGLDALSQSIESYWSVKSTDESRAIALAAIKLILANIRTAVLEPTIESRAAMAKASHDSGRAINLTTTTAPHAISYPLTTDFGLAHGVAVACTLPEFLIINSSRNNILSRLNPELDADSYSSNLKRIFDVFGCVDGVETASFLYTMVSELGVDLNLSKLGFDLPPKREFTDKINIQRLQNNPIQLTAEDIATALSQPNLLRN